MIIVRVLLFLLPDLDPIEYRPVRQTYIAQSLGISPSRVCGAIAQLVRGGILEQTDRRAQLADRAFVKQYRLNWKQAECGRFIAFVYGKIESGDETFEPIQVSQS